VTVYICPPEHRHAENATCYVEHTCRCDECRRGRAEDEYWRNHMAAAGKPLLVDAVGLHRRIRALGAIGWSSRMLGARYGRSSSWFSHLLRTPRVTPSTAALVRRMYDDLAMTPPQPVTKNQRGQVTKTKQFAEAHGFPPPLAWDDDSIDDPTAEPAEGWGKPAAVTDESFLTRVDAVVIEAAIRGEQPRLSPPERREVITRLNGSRWSATRIAEWIGCNPRTVTRIRGELGLPSYDQMEIRDAA